MDLNIIVKFLDDFFKTKQFGPDLPFSNVIPSLYSNDSNFSNFISEDFKINFNGLMFKNSDKIDESYSTVFLSEDIIDRLSNNKKNKLLITHHPSGDNTSNKGFYPLSETYLKKIKDFNISVYSLHNPLDQNINISTSKSIANALSLTNLEYFINNEGIIGEFPESLSTEELLSIIKNIFEINDLKVLEKIKINRRIAIVAGGGSDPEIINEVIKLNPDTYLTGEYVSRIDNEFAKKERSIFNELLPKIGFNLIGASHFATESLVFKNEFKKLLEDNLGINLKFLTQEDPWF